MTGQPLDAGTIAELPKVLLHDHLDGGVRPSTLLELSDAQGLDLPADDAEGLASWFVTSAAAGSLEAYLATFDRTLAVMQSADALRRIAREAVEDLAADGVVYAEQRYAPELHVAGGLEPQQVVDAVTEGVEEGVAAAAGAGRRIRVAQVLTAMRTGGNAADVARLALENRLRGVLGFDLAGAEAGNPPSRHAAAFRTLRYASFPVTVHAGEAAGAGSVAEALHIAGAIRIGHGVHVIDDVVLGEPTEDDPWGVEKARFGDIAHWVRDQQVPLEVCPTSNVHTGATPSIAQHPVTALLRLGFAVTVNTDNRLMSGTSLTNELAALVEHAGWTRDDLRDVTLTAAWNGFIHHDERAELVEDVIIPGFTERSNGRHRA
ncbi:adenosine deaminase [Actinotalea sp. AC32]|nr:adenosine deaminase [Actinotalea sp. AC32]